MNAVSEKTDFKEGDEIILTVHYGTTFYTNMEMSDRITVMHGEYHGEIVRSAKFGVLLVKLILKKDEAFKNLADIQQMCGEPINSFSLEKRQTT